MMTRDSADLWFSPTTPLSVAGEDAGAFGTVCEAIGADAKKSVSDQLKFPDLPFFCPAS